MGINAARVGSRRTGATILCAALFLPISVLATPLIPTAPGTAWRYNMTEELGKGVSVPNETPDADGKIRVQVLYRVDGAQDFEGKELLKFEMYRTGVVTNTDLLTVNESEIACSARINLDGDLVKLDPPQTIVATPLKPGATWNFDGQAGDLKVQQGYKVTGEENVDVPAGKFRAFHIHGEQTLPSPMTIDRWFVPGIGIVKDVTTNRSANGDLLERISLALLERPKIVERPEIKSDVVPKKFSASVAKTGFGKPTTTFSSDTPQICARWQANRLRPGAKITAAWIAENIGEDFPQDHKVDAASTTAGIPNAHGVFTLTRPEEGWAPGDYRVEFYIDDVFADAVELKIVK